MEEVSCFFFIKFHCSLYLILVWGAVCSLTLTCLIQINFHFRSLQPTPSILLNLGMWFQLPGKKTCNNKIWLSFYCPESKVSNIWPTDVSQCLYFSHVEHWLNILYNVDIVILRFEKMENGCRKDLDALKNAFKHNDPVPKFHYENKTFSLVQ